MSRLGQAVASGPNPYNEEQLKQAAMGQMPIDGAAVNAQTPVRVNLLHFAAHLTSGDRDREYGDPMVNLQCATQLKEVFWAHQRESGRSVSQAEREAVDMVLTKLSRIACGPKPKDDTYIDGAAYFAIAGEAMIKHRDGNLPRARSETFVSK